MSKTLEDFYQMYGVATVREQSYKDELQEMMNVIFRMVSI